MCFLKILAKPFVWAHYSAGVNRGFAIADKIICAMDKNIAVFGMAIGIIIVALNVCVRYISGIFPEFGGMINMTWAEETARYCFLWSAFFGAAHGFRNGVHISVTFIVEKFSKPVQKALIIATHTLNSLFLAFMAYASIDVCVLNAEIGYMSEAIRSVPLWVFLLFLPISFCVATYRSIEKIYEISWTPANEVLNDIKEEMVYDSTHKGKL